MDDILNALQKIHVLPKQKDNLQVVKVSSADKGVELVKELLYKIVDSKTLLFLSGGTTPKTLYEILAKEKKIKPGAVALVDERYGLPMHENSNEKMIKDAGFLDYIAMQNIPFYGILEGGLILSEAAKYYNDIMTVLLSKYTKKIAILGIGEDGHTAGIAPNRSGFVNPLFSQHLTHLVNSFDDANGPFGQRITVTFAALQQMGVLMSIVFGEKKAQALQKMFAKGPIEEIPARFYLLNTVVDKAILITDQNL